MDGELTGKKMSGTVGKAAEVRDLEEALKALVKLMKAIRYYPPGHPSLKNAVAQTLDAFSAVLAGRETLLLAVRKQGFFSGETPVAPENPLLQKLALFLFSRRIHRLLVLPDLSAQDLRAFVRSLSLSPEEIQKRGGFQEVLLKARVSTLWINEVDLARKKEIEEERRARSGFGTEEEEEELFFGEGQGDSSVPAAGEDTPSERTLGQVLDELEATGDDQNYRMLLQELVPLVHLSLNEADRGLVLRAMTLLCRNASNRSQTIPRREYSLQALAQLTADEVVDFLVSILCDGTPQNDTRRQVNQVLVFLKDRAVNRLMEKLAAENDSKSRKYLAEALILQGSSATPILTEYLGDKRWYMVRNAVIILGEIRDSEATANLAPSLRHGDIRVRRETIRALTKIGGPDAVNLLLRVLEEKDEELGPQALLSLGAMKNPAAVPILLKMVGKTDPWLKQAEIKKATVKALGEIGSEEALPALHQVLGRRKLWQRSRYDNIRAAAALALGEIGSAESLPLLETAADDRSETVARAAVQAMKQIKKGPNGP